jgi:hypothetical protein
MFRYSDPAAGLTVGVGFNDCVDVDPHAASNAAAAITAPTIYLRRTVATSWRHLLCIKHK